MRVCFQVLLSAGLLFCDGDVIYVFYVMNVTDVADIIG